MAHGVRVAVRPQATQCDCVRACRNHRRSNRGGQVLPVVRTLAGAHPCGKPVGERDTPGVGGSPAKGRDDPVACVVRPRYTADDVWQGRRARPRRFRADRNQSTTPTARSDLARVVPVSGLVIWPSGVLVAWGGFPQTARQWCAVHRTRRGSSALAQGSRKGAWQESGSTIHASGWAAEQAPLADPPTRSRRHTGARHTHSGVASVLRTRTKVG